MRTPKPVTRSELLVAAARAARWGSAVGLRQSFREIADLEARKNHGRCATLIRQEMDAWEMQERQGVVVAAQIEEPAATPTPRHRRFRCPDGTHDWAPDTTTSFIGAKRCRVCDVPG